MPVFFWLFLGLRAVEPIAMLHSSVYERAAAEKLMHFYDPAGNTIPIICLTKSSFSGRGMGRRPQRLSVVWPILFKRQPEYFNLPRLG